MHLLEYNESSHQINSSMVCIISLLRPRDIYVVNSLWPSDTIWHHSTLSSLVQVKAWRLFVAKPMLYCRSTHRNKIQWYFIQNLNIFNKQNAFQNVVYKIVAILFRSQCLNSVRSRYVLTWIYEVPVKWTQPWLNPLRAKFFRGNKSIYLHFMSILSTDMTQVIGILPHERPKLGYFS